MVKHSKGLRKIDTGQNGQRISLSHIANADGSHGKSHGTCSGSICSMRCLASSLRLETMQVDTSKGPMPLLAKACAGTIETIGAQQLQKSPKQMLEERPYCICLETCHIFVTEIQQAQSPICIAIHYCRDAAATLCELAETSLERYVKIKCSEVTPEIVNLGREDGAVILQP